MLNKIPRWTKRNEDPPHFKAGVSPGYLCARSYSNSDNFVAKASLRDGIWVVTQAETAAPSRRESIDVDAKRRCPFTAQQLVPVVLSSVRVKPDLDASLIRSQLEAYVRKQFLVDSIIQQTREKARLVAFGKPEVNIQYMEQLIENTRRVGHKAKLVTM